MRLPDEEQVWALRVLAEHDLLKELLAYVQEMEAMGHSVEKLPSHSGTPSLYVRGKNCWVNYADGTRCQILQSLYVRCRRCKKDWAAIASFVGRRTPILICGSHHRRTHSSAQEEGKIFKSVSDFVFEEEKHERC